MISHTTNVKQGQRDIKVSISFTVTKTFQNDWDNDLPEENLAQLPFKHKIASNQVEGNQNSGHKDKGKDLQAVSNTNLEMINLEQKTEEK